MSRSRRKRRHTTQAGAQPGSLTPLPGARPPIVRAVAYGPDDFVEREIHEVSQIRPLLEKWPVVWVNVDGLGDVNVLQRLGDLFGLHPLALEDVLDVHQRAKLDLYDKYLLFVARQIRIAQRAESEQISLFLGQGFVITFQQHHRKCFDAVRERIRQAKGRVRGMAADYLAYCLIDTIIDDYFPILEHYGEVVDWLEEEILISPSHDAIKRAHEIKSDLFTIRRAIWPHREAISALARDENKLITAETRTYLRDCIDHVVQILDLVESYREVGAALHDLYLSSVSNRMNDVMRILTVIATIFIPLTFIAGVYGMNFDPRFSPWNMPELRWYYGYPAVLLVMTVVVIIQLILFRRKGWLGGDPATKPPDSKPPQDRPGEV